MKKQKRDLRSGRYTQDRTLYKGIIIAVGIYAAVTFSFIGVNTILKTVSEIIIVNDTEAETINWEDGVKSIIEDYKLDWKIAKRIIYCESQFNPNAKNINRNGSEDIGLWQINDLWDISENERLDPIKSTYATVRIVVTHGWDEWVTYRKYVSKGIRCPWVSPKDWD